MKVCLAVHRFPPYIGGCEKYAYNLASGLSDRGIKVTVYTSRHRFRSKLKQNFQIREFHAIKFPRSGYFLWPGAFDPRVIKELSGFDIIHAVDFSMFSSMVGIISKKLYNTPTVLTCTYHPPSAMIHKRLKKLYDEVIGRRILNKYDILIIHSYHELKSLKNCVGHVDFKKIRKIPHGLPMKLKPQMSFRSRYGLNDDFVVLYVGRIDFHKGIVHVLEAIKFLVTQNAIKNLRMVLVGEKESWYKWPSSVRELVEDLEGRIIFTNKVPPKLLSSAYIESDVVVLSSKYETFSYVLLEALSHGTPVISTKVGIAPEIIIEGVNGFSYKYGDVHDLASKIKCVYKKGDDLKSYTSKSVSGFTLEKEIQQTIEVYRCLV